MQCELLGAVQHIFPGTPFLAPNNSLKDQFQAASTQAAAEAAMPNTGALHASDKAMLVTYALLAAGAYFALKG